MVVIDFGALEGSLASSATVAVVIKTSMIREMVFGCGIGTGTIILVAIAIVDVGVFASIVFT